MQYYQQWLLMIRLVSVLYFLHATLKIIFGKNPNRMCISLAHTSLKDYEAIQHSAIESLTLRR